MMSSLDFPMPAPLMDYDCVEDFRVSCSLAFSEVGRCDDDEMPSIFTDNMSRKILARALVERMEDLRSTID